MLDYKLLHALDAVVREGGFDRASQRLNITQSAVSQRIRLLEDLVGGLLVTRTTPPRPTGEGKILLKHFSQVQSLERDLENSLKGPDSPGFQTLSLGINADSLATWFFPAVKDFLRVRPILLDLKVDDQDQTHKLLRDGDVAGCISSEQTPVQGCSARFIGEMNYRLVAAQDFCRRYFPGGIESGGMDNVPAVIFNRKDDLHLKFFRQFLGRSLGKIPIHYVPSSEKFVQVILDGLAYGMVPDLQGKKHLENGILVDLAPDHHIRVPLYWHRWNLKTSLLDEFSNIIVKNAVIC
ncbi:LysR family transcriptional regulator ArgP [Desulfospira joergensenii]|uniref:LysR family transcriptional regulator ArgP n=1 Tax=Desulfospira joergensenii TaxID=53329 RepID=UPI0003FBE955|nr:LysR family transcriptional regulator ArgP [Desulfospira joergensenii]